MHPAHSTFSGPYVRRHDPLQDLPTRADLRIVALAGALSGVIATSAIFLLARFL